MLNEFTPAYPGDPTPEEQIEAIKSEYEEVLEAKEECWQRVAKELLDLAQTVVGYCDIVRDDWKVSLREEKLEFGSYYDLEDVDTFWKYYKAGFAILEELFWLAVYNFEMLILQHDRNNENYYLELKEMFLDQHKEKLLKRRREWAKEV